MPTYVNDLPYRLPERVDQPGLLVGWSLEAHLKRPPIGFHYGSAIAIPPTGCLDPVLLQDEGHLMTIAPTGAGKGVGCIIPALLRHQGPIIVIDPKGENVAITARQRRQLGQTVVVLDPMNVTGLSQDQFNPLDVIDISRATAVDEVSALSQTLVGGASSDPRDVFWRQRAQHLIIGVILDVLQHAYEARLAGHNARADLLQVRERINDATANPKALADAMSASAHPEVMRIANLLRIDADTTLGGILAFAQEGVDFMRGDQIQTVLTNSTFNVDDITTGAPLSIFLVLPPHMLESHGRLLRLWIGAMLSAIARRRGRPKHSTLLVLDEAAQLGPLAQLRQAVTLLRGYGVQTWSFWQDVSQLQQLYPLDWKTMVNNCRVLHCFGALNGVSAEDMADLTGFKDRDTVLDLRPDEMLLQIAGDNAVIARLPNYLKDPIFSGQSDPNPYYQSGGMLLPDRGAPQRLYQRAPQTASAPKSSDRVVMMPYASVVKDDPFLGRLLKKWAPPTQ